MILPMPLATRLRKNALLLFVVIVELLLLVAAAQQTTLPITPLSLAVAISMAAAGIFPALLQPSAVARLGGIFLVMLATLILTPSAINMLQPSVMPAAPFLTAAPFYLSLRLLNGVLLFPVGLHLAYQFRRQISAPTLPRTVLMLCYALTLLLLGGLLLLPSGTLRVWSGWLILFCCFGVVLLALGQTGRIIGRNDRPAQQTRLLIIGLWLAQLPILTRVPLFLLTGISLPFEIVLIAQLILPLIYVYTILRHDLYDIDATVRRTLAALIVSATLVALYLLVTLLLTRVLLLRTGAFNYLAIMGLLLIASALFQPLYRRLQRWIDGWLFPERAIFQREVATVQTRLATVNSREAVTAALVQFAAQIGADWSSGGRIERATRPIAFNATERRQLATVGTLATVALAYADTLDRLNALNQDLAQQVEQRTRQLVSQQRELAVGEERQRLARDLHDSVTQTLFSLSLSLRAIRKLAIKQPAMAVEELAVQEQTAHHALAEMRTLLTQLRTPLVTDGDLAHTLRAHVGLLRRQGIPVTLHVLGEGDFSAEIATELLLLIREALHNAYKHSGASQITCTLTQNSVVIADNGRGFDTAIATSGIGMNSMRQRVAAIGGTLKLTSTDVGTQVEVRFKQTHVAGVETPEHKGEGI